MKRDRDEFVYSARKELLRLKQAGQKMRRSIQETMDVIANTQRSVKGIKTRRALRRGRITVYGELAPVQKSGKLLAFQGVVVLSRSRDS
jgi:hypothetical protein